MSGDPLAEKGHAAAQYSLGLLYANGQGVPKDDTQARPWDEKAAAQGRADAQVNLGILYDYGRGVPQDFKKAVYWYRLSAHQENDLAQRQLGLLYERGDGMDKTISRPTCGTAWGRRAEHSVEPHYEMRSPNRCPLDQIAEARHAGAGMEAETQMSNERP